MKSLITSLILSTAMVAGASVAAQPERPAASVVVKTVQELNVGASVTVNGVVRSRTELALPSLVQGELLWVLEEGSPVARNDVIARLDDRHQQLQLTEQKLMKERAAINLRYLDGEVARLEKLSLSHLAAQNQVAEMISRRDMAANDLALSTARVAQLQETISDMQIRSPINGVVVERSKSMGEYVRAGEPVVRLLDPASLEVQVAMPLMYLNQLPVSQRVDVRVQGVEFAASVRAALPSGNVSSQTFNLLVEVPVDAALRMVAGQYADVVVPVTESSQALFVPRDAVVLRSEGSYVYRIDDENVASRIAVDLGKGQGSMVSVTGALKKGDRIAVRGIEKLADGQAVKLLATG